MKVIVATLKTNEQGQRKLKNILIQLAEPSRKEVGNYRYDLCQNTEDPNTFVVVEEWQDQAAVDAHFSSEHFKDAVGALGDLLVQDPEIKIHEVTQTTSP